MISFPPWPAGYKGTDEAYAKLLGNPGGPAMAAKAECAHARGERIVIQSSRAAIGRVSPSGAHRPGRGSFHNYSLREHVCQPQLTGRQKKFEVKSFGSPNCGEFEEPLTRRPDGCRW